MSESVYLPLLWTAHFHCSLHTHYTWMGQKLDKLDNFTHSWYLVYACKNSDSVDRLLQFFRVDRHRKCIPFVLLYAVLTLEQTTWTFMFINCENEPGIKCTKFYRRFNSAKWNNIVFVFSFVWFLLFASSFLVFVGVLFSEAQIPVASLF